MNVPKRPLERFGVNRLFLQPGESVLVGVDEHLHDRRTEHAEIRIGFCCGDEFQYPVTDSFLIGPPFVWHPGFDSPPVGVVNARIAPGFVSVVVPHPRICHIGEGHSLEQVVESTILYETLQVTATRHRYRLPDREQVVTAWRSRTRAGKTTVSRQTHARVALRRTRCKRPFDELGIRARTTSPPNFPIQLAHLLLGIRKYGQDGAEGAPHLTCPNKFGRTTKSLF